MANEGARHSILVTKRQYNLVQLTPEPWPDTSSNCGIGCRGVRHSACCLAVGIRLLTLRTDISSALQKPRFTRRWRLRALQSRCEGSPSVPCGPGPGQAHLGKSRALGGGGGLRSRGQPPQFLSACFKKQQRAFPKSSEDSPSLGSASGSRACPDVVKAAKKQAKPSSQTAFGLSESCAKQRRGPVGGHAEQTHTREERILPP